MNLMILELETANSSDTKNIILGREAKEKDKETGIVQTTDHVTEEKLKTELKQKVLTGLEVIRNTAYASPDDAAMAFVKTMNPLSNYENREYAAFIYERRGKYYLNDFHRGAHNNTIQGYLRYSQRLKQPLLLDSIFRGVQVAYVHVHPPCANHGYMSNKSFFKGDHLAAAVTGSIYAGQANGDVLFYKTSMGYSKVMLIGRIPNPTLQEPYPQNCATRDLFGRDIFR